MATIRKRGNSYQIRVSCGYDTNGKQVEQSITWKPAEGMTDKQIEKELKRQTVLFEEACNNGYLILNTNKTIDKIEEIWYNKKGDEKCLKHIKSAKKMQLK